MKGISKALLQRDGLSDYNCVAKDLVQDFTLFIVFIISLLMNPAKISAQDKKVMIFYETNDLHIRGHLQFGLNTVAETNLFWNLADVEGFDFDSDTEWLEAYLKPGLSVEKTYGSDALLYGKISSVSSYTLGTDAFDAENTGRITLEEAHIGYKISFNESSQLDISFGSRELKLGTGMLIANGGSNGFERGALKLGPRKAWQIAAISDISIDNIRGRLFFISPNEQKSNDTENRLAGIDLFYGNEKSIIGLTYLKVINSLAPYPKASPDGIGPPIITSGDRDGLNGLNLYVKTNPIKSVIESLFLNLDLAYEWNERIDMSAWAGRVQLGNTFSNFFWSPLLMYYYQTFSGDDPGTSKQERFDPLYYEGSPSAWSTGSKSSMVFINSNVQAHGLTLRFLPTMQDIVTLRYSHIRVNELRSTIQFGQATRVVFSGEIPTVFPGVTQPHLADDFFIEYTRVISHNIYLTTGFSLSVAGNGISSITGDTANWTGGFINVVCDF
jgi:hypothetical protein